jgi:hypothetical protein
MKRLRSLLTVAVLMLAMLLATAFPAFAAGGSDGEGAAVVHLAAGGSSSSGNQHNNYHCKNFAFC